MQSIAELADVYQGLAHAGRGVGLRRGEWMLRIVESSDVRDDGWLDIGDLREVGLVHGVRAERHLLRPFDLLVTARTGSVQVALVPPEVSRTVAGITLLVVRAKQPESGMGHWPLVLPHFIPWPGAARQTDDGERHAQVAVS